MTKNESLVTHLLHRLRWALYTKKRKHLDQLYRQAAHEARIRKEWGLAIERLRVENLERRAAEEQAKCHAAD
jgi:hypothetical protein